MMWGNRGREWGVRGGLGYRERMGLDGEKGRAGGVVGRGYSIMGGVDERGREGG